MRFVDDQLVKSVADWFSIPVAAVILCAVLGAALWIWIRTGTSSVLLDRFWRLVIGDTLSKDSVIGKAVTKNLTLVEFRFRFFPKTRTTVEAEAAIAWAEAHGEDIGNVAACGDYFDIRDCRMRERIPRVRTQMLILLLATAMLIGTAFMASLSIRTEPLIRVINTNNFYWVASDRIRTFSNKDEVSKAECDAGAGARKLMDGAVLCGILASKSDLDHLTKSMPVQRGMILVVALYALWMTGLAYRWFLRATRAYALTRRIAKSTADKKALAKVPPEDGQPAV